MPVIDDIIKTSFSSLQVGVAMNNDIYWRVQDLGVDPGNLLSLIAITDAYFAAWKEPLVDTIAIQCAVYNNETSPEAKEIDFPVGKVGVILTAGHAQDQVVRYDEYTMEQPDGSLKRGAYNLSGTPKALSTDGLINDITPFLDLRTFLMDQLILGAGWTIKPVQRFERTRGDMNGAVPAAEMTDTFQAFVVDELIGRKIFNDTDKSSAVITSNTATIVTGVLLGGTNNNWQPGDHYHIKPANFAFDDVVEVILGTTFTKLASRKTKLCQVA